MVSDSGELVFLSSKGGKKLSSSLSLFGYDQQLFSALIVLLCGARALKEPDRFRFVVSV